MFRIVQLILAGTSKEKSNKEKIFLSLRIFLSIFFVSSSELV